MKKVVFLLLLSSMGWAAGPKHEFSDPLLNDEMVNIYKDISTTLKGNVRISSVTITSATITNLRGVTDGSNACAECVGVYIESVVSASPVTFPTSGQWGDVTSISLTAGDWNVTGRVLFDNGGTAIETTTRIGISTTTGNSNTGLVVGNNHMVDASGGGIDAITSNEISNYRFSIATSTTVYLKHNVTYTSTAGTSSGIISARRVR